MDLATIVGMIGAIGFIACGVVAVFIGAVFGRRKNCS
jgi:hypothetical protein